MDVSLYFHIPFCAKKCPYCHFYVLPNQSRFHKKLLNGLFQEWQLRRPQLENCRIASIYFGGGTPTLLAPKGIEQILNWIFNSHLTVAVDCEITIEANPEESSLKLFEDLLNAGINRISIGVQSLDDRALETLERQHSAERAKNAVHLASQAGFENISIDLMYDLPHQTLGSWEHTLLSAVQLPITHLSLYNLTIEPHTAFYQRQKMLLPSLPSPQLSLELLNCALEILPKHGLTQYEISAFARNQKIAIHNTGYWTARPFLGFGPSAFSFWEGNRFRNIAHLERYSRLLEEGKSPVDFSEKLSYPANLKELFAVRCRLFEWINLHDWNLPPDTLYSIEQFAKRGWMEQKGTSIRLTPRGRLIYDSLAEELIEAS